MFSQYLKTNLKQLPYYIITPKANTIAHQDGKLNRPDNLFSLCFIMFILYLKLVISSTLSGVYANNK